MQWLVYFLGVALISGGLGALYSSIDLIGVERGTVLALTGTISLCCGVLTLCVGFVLSAVNSIARTLRSGAALAVGLPKVRDAAFANMPSTLHADTPAALARPAPDVAQVEAGHVEAARAGAGHLEASPAVPRAARVSAGIAAAAAAGALLAPRAEPVAPPREMPVDPLLAQAENWHAQAAAMPAASLPAASLRDESLQPELVHAGPVHVEPEHSEPVQAGPAHAESIHAEPAPQDAVGDDFAGEAPAAETFDEVAMVQAHETPPPLAHEGEDATPEPLPEPVVVGRYNAGGAAYVMYSDGSIEAETQSGHYRFNSMSELKAFIEDKAAQDGTREMASL